MTKKNVLVISEQFTKGGLEVHILNQVAGLKDDVNFVFAFGKYEKNEKLKNNKVYDIGSFSNDYTISKFYEQVRTLLDIVEKEDIDVIHAHPFMSLLPAIFTSVISGKPMIYTLHGGPSLSMYSDVFSYIFLQRFFFSCLDQQIISVRQEFEDVKVDYDIKNYNYIPNSIITDDYESIKRATNNKWALLARLDHESQTAIFDILDKINDINIDGIDIYGVGVVEDTIKAYIIEKNLSDRVRLCGWSDGVAGALRSNEYEGVIGHGQTALDALAAGFPVLLLSYGRITGLVDDTLYDAIKKYNFVNIYQKSVSSSEIVDQFTRYHKKPEDYILTSRVIKDFDNNVVQNEYLRVVKSATHKYSTQIADIWDRINALAKEQPVIFNEQFLSSITLEQIIEESSLRYGLVVSPSLLNLVNQNRQSRKQKEENTYLKMVIDGQTEKINNRQAELDNFRTELDSLHSIKTSLRLLAGNIKRRITRRSK